MPTSFDSELLCIVAAADQTKSNDAVRTALGSGEADWFDVGVNASGDIKIAVDQYMSNGAISTADATALKTELDLQSVSYTWVLKNRLIGESTDIDAELATLSLKKLEATNKLDPAA